MYFIKLIILSMLFKFMCCIGLVDSTDNKAAVIINVEKKEIHPADENKKKMEAPRYTPISIKIQ